jgi:GT2 family glycosyltransferase
VYGPRGLCAQRNVALAATRADCDIIVFFDDDFIPSRWFLANLETFLQAHPEVVAATGELVCDGINLGGCPIEEARALVNRADASAKADYNFWEITHLYGCNMAARLPIAAQVGFDERLPLYAWQEDRDFSRRLKAHGRVVRTKALSGAHLGVTLSRTPGQRLGYSQVANPVYLLRKGTMKPIETAMLVGRNITANIVKTLHPEPWVDRPGRLLGNLKAIADVARGRITPERILQL